MAANYYPQSDHRPATLTVGHLIERLSALDPAAPVIFRSPLYGAFGGNTTYSIDKVEAVAVERREEHHDGGVTLDDETGEELTYEAWTQVFEAWSGVVIG